MRRPRQSLALCLLWLLHSNLPGAQAQRPPSPLDEEFRALLGAIDASQEDGRLSDLGYLVESLDRLEDRLSADAQASEDQRLLLPLLYFRINQNSRGVKLLESYLEESPSSVRGRLLLALGYLRQEQYLQAKRLTEGVVEGEPNHSYAHYLLGLSHLGLHRLEAAAAALQQAVSLDPGFSEAHRRLGLLYSKTADTMESARQHLEKALELQRESPQIRTELGFVLLKLGRYQEAMLHLNRAVELDENFAEAYYSLASVYRNLNRNAEAEAALQRFAALQSAEHERAEKEANGRSYYERAIQLLRSQGDHLREAHGLLEQTIEIFPNLAPAHYRKAQIELLEQRLPAALASIRRAIELNPLEAEHYYVLALCLKEGDPAAAIDALRKAIYLAPNEADFHNLLGNLLFAGADYAGAVDSYRQAARISPDSALVHLNLAAALEKTGDLRKSEEARERYRRLIRERP